MSQFASNLNLQVPVYVTRKTADGYTGSYSQSLWMTILAQLLVWTNIVLWGVVGVWKAVEVFV